MINSKIIIKKLEENKKEIKAKGITKIGLFGSFVKNKQNSKSDIDILVEFSHPTFDNYAEALLLLEKIFKKKIDLLTKQQLRPELKYILKETKYARL